MPTFVILSSGKEVDRVQGADRSSLTSAVERHVRNAGPPKPAYSGTGYTLGADKPKAAVAPARYIRNGQVVSNTPIGRRLGGWFDSIVTFVILYFVSLFSVDAIPAAEKSSFAVGSGGSGGSGPGGPGGPGGRKLGTINQVRAPACRDGSCG